MTRYGNPGGLQRSLSACLYVDQRKVHVTVKFASMKLLLFGTKVNQGIQIDSKSCCL